MIAVHHPAQRIGNTNTLALAIRTSLICRSCSQCDGRSSRARRQSTRTTDTPPTHSVTPVSASRSPDLDSPFDSRMSVATHSPSLDSFCPSAMPALPAASCSPLPPQVVPQVRVTECARPFHSLTLYSLNLEPPSRSPSAQTLPASRSVTPIPNSLSLDMATPVSASPSPDLGWRHKRGRSHQRWCITTGAERDGRAGGRQGRVQQLRRNPHTTVAPQTQRRA